MRRLIRVSSLLWGMLLCLSLPVKSACVPAPLPPSAAEIQQLQEAARDHGFLWKISKDGRTSWLYGSIHINRLSAAFPGPKVRQAVQQSQALVLELDMADPVTQAKLAQLSRQGAGQVPNALKGRLKAQLDKVCLPESIAQSIHPALLFVTMSVLGLRESGYEAAYGTEYMLAASGKKVIPLETAESQMQALLGDGSVSAAEYAEGLALIENKNSQTMSIRLLDAWTESDLFTLESFADWCDCMNTPKQRADMRRVLDERNPPMADNIAKLHNQSAPIFVAVGSLHMIGKNGLPALLTKRGFKVERVGFDN
ncbi:MULTISPECIES: TraB/GumN family protein [Deefgea]|uniref:TraB/GumN family protein n=1 Tax=Deefgea chitinilytica TaxID=570276 RepID=A0ABS2CEX4_9NEIS|nr:MULTISPECIES: TraB/GumN family protein [Deefgea]MBM5572698.1 TraB/GumN family protein [Deefgea chitinilytica]MBM9889934.1 TraB/GumN family protein [Deefgea sp. CFH1-16]